MRNKSNESMEKLAEAMGKLADSLEKFQDPVLWQKVLSDAISLGVFPQAVVQQMRALPPVEGIRVERIEIGLTDEEREKVASKIYEAVQPQLSEFNEFVKQSLIEMPAGRLRELAKKIEEGAKPSLGRRKGCVFITTGDDDFYLGL